MERLPHQQRRHQAHQRQNEHAVEVEGNPGERHQNHTPGRRKHGHVAGAAHIGHEQPGGNVGFNEVEAHRHAAEARVQDHCDDLEGIGDGKGVDDQGEVRHIGCADDQQHGSGHVLGPELEPDCAGLLH